MPIQLLVAVFDYSSLAEKAIADAIAVRPEFVRALATVSVFDRMVDNTLIARMVQLEGVGTVVDVSRKVLSEDLLRRMLPTRADWSVLSAAFGPEFPRSALNGEFCAFLEIMMLQRTSSVFFIPQDEADAHHFINSMRITASVVLHTTMTPEELQTLRGCLVASRQSEPAEAL